MNKLDKNKMFRNFIIRQFRSLEITTQRKVSKICYLSLQPTGHLLFYAFSSKYPCQTVIWLDFSLTKTLKIPFSSPPSESDVPHDVLLEACKDAEYNFDPQLYRSLRKQPEKMNNNKIQSIVISELLWKWILLFIVFLGGGNFISVWKTKTLALPRQSINQNHFTYDRFQYTRAANKGGHLPPRHLWLKPA